MSPLTALVAAGVGFDVTPSPSATPVQEIDPSRVTPGYLGLFFFVALAVAVFFLWRSMNHQLKKITVPDDDVPVDTEADAAAAAPVPDADPAAGSQSDEGPPRR